MAVCLGRLETIVIITLDCHSCESRNPYNSNSVMFSDQKTTISELRELCQKFRLERNWQKASAATFAKDIAVEAGELLDHFVWDEDAYLHDPLIAKEVHHELVDVLYGVLAMSDILKIDLSTTLQEKIKILAKKYPVAACRKKNQLDCTERMRWYTKRRSLFRKKKNV